jgi:hypothetical protein
MSNWAIISDKVWYTDAKTLWIRLESEKRSKQYPIDPKINVVRLGPQ